MQLITKFNSIIRSRILWGAFAVVISITFVGTYTAQRGNDDAREQDEGMLFGQTVPSQRLNLAVRFVRNMHEMDGTRQPDARTVRKLAWQRLAMLALADRLKIQVSTDEIAKELQRQRVFNNAFNAKGQIDDIAFRSIIERVYNLDKETFLLYIREQLTIQKLSGLIGFGAWTSPLESISLLRNYLDKFTIQYAPMARSNLVSITNTTVATAEHFFSSHTNLFLVPEQRSVYFVAFPLSNYFPQVNVTEKDIRDYYEQHIDEYVERSTNGTEIAIPFERVSTNVQAIMLAEKARTKAETDGTRFMDLLLSDRGKKGLSFAEAAARLGIDVHTSSLFSADQPVPGMNVGREFNELAFGLDPEEPDRQFSDPLSLTDAVYIVSFLTNVAPRIPAFSEVVDQVMPLALTNAIEEAFLQTLTNSCEKVRTAVADGKTFKDAVDALTLGLNITTTRSFSAYEAQMQYYYQENVSNQVEYAYALIPKIVNHYAGEVLDPVPVDDELALLTFISDRLPGDLSDTEQLKLTLVRDMDRKLSSLLLADWSDHLLQLAEFKDFRPLPETDEGEDEEDDSTSAPRRKFQLVD